MYIAFLRGINIGSKNKINMAELKQLLENLGFTHVRTLLNSGNAVFDYDMDDISKLETIIEEAIHLQFNLSINVIIRDSNQINSLIAQYPFDLTDDKNHYITLFKSAITQDQLKKLEESINEAKLPDDLFKASDFELFLYLPTGYGRTKLNNSFVEKKSSSIGTTRNLNTLKKLEMLL